jgi:hypothetical protein
VNSALALAATIGVLVAASRGALSGRSWADRTPRATIALWQAIALSMAVSVSLLGAVTALSAFGGRFAGALHTMRDFVFHQPAHYLTPNQLFALTAAIIAVSVVVTTVSARVIGELRAGARHRRLVELLGDSRPDLPDVLIVPDDRATAYCLPGRHAHIVLSRGAVNALSNEQLAAVLSHERAHVRARHHLVLIPFAVAAAATGSQWLRRARDEVRTLVELAADDAAIRRCDRGALASALCRLSVVEPPPLGFAARSGPLTRRVAHVCAVPTSHRLQATTTALAGGAALALPWLALHLVGGG